MLKPKRFIALLTALALFFLSTTVATANDSSSITRVQEVEALRETNSETYLMSDGTYECVVYSYDKYYVDETSTLQLIDNTIVKAGDTSSTATYQTASSKQYKNAANAFKIYFSDSNIPEVNIQYDGKGITFSPFNSLHRNNLQVSPYVSKLTIGQIDNCSTLEKLTYTGDNTVTYANTFADTDLVYVLENNSLKEYIILNNNTAPSEFSFMFTLDGVTLTTVNGNICFIDSDGTIVFTLGSLFAIDAKGIRTEDISCSYSPIPKTNNVIITVALSDTYFSSSERAFPIVIDPSVMISSSETADACVCSGYPSTNYQIATQLRTGYDTDYGIRRSYIKFNIPASIPANSVTNATLDIEKLSGTAPTTKAYRCTGYWTSGTITWNNKADYTTTNQSTVATLYRPGSTWYTMNVTDIVQGWVNYTHSNYGFVIKDITETNPDHWTTLYSSDAPSPHKPELHIVYNGNITPIGLSSNITQYMEAGNHYQYSFTPTETGTYEFESEGSIDTYGILYQDLTQLAINDDSGTGSNFKISWRLISGVKYTLLVKGYSSTTTGTFTVTVAKGWPEASKPDILPRSNWEARDPIQSRLEARTREPQRIIFHHSADKFSKTDLNSVTAEIRKIQNKHIDQDNKCDIAYHFIIDPAGRIWTGAEIDNFQRGHAEGYFDDIGVVILGDFSTRFQNGWTPDILNSDQKYAMIVLAEWLCSEYDLLMIDSGQNAAPITTHRTVDHGTVCPGVNAAPWIENNLRSTIADWRS